MITLRASDDMFSTNIEVYDYIPEVAEGAAYHLLDLLKQEYGNYAFNASISRMG